MTRFKIALTAGWIAFWAAWRHSGDECHGLDEKPETPKLAILVGGSV